MTCPPFTDLCALDAAAVFHEHLAACPRCRAIVARAKASGAAPVGFAPMSAPVAPGPAPRAGGVWTFWMPTADEYVVGAVLKADATKLLIVPLLVETTWASEEDLRLPPDVLGYSALAPVWAGDHVLVEQAVEAVDTLSGDVFALLTAAHDAFSAGETVPGPVGPPVLGEQDPRVAAHAAIADHLRKLYEPWAVLQVADELGPVVAQRRAQLGVGMDELDVEPAIWKAFESNKVSPDVHIPAKTLARAVRRLGLVASRRLVELARASVLAHHAGDDFGAARAMSRRRQGVRRPRRDPEAARVAADRYSDALTRELGL